VIVLDNEGFGENAHRYYLSAIDPSGAVYFYGGAVWWPPEAGPRVTNTLQPEDTISPAS
jgi:hypothetical protein